MMTDEQTPPFTGLGLEEKCKVCNSHLCECSEAKQWEIRNFWDNINNELLNQIKFLKKIKK